MTLPSSVTLKLSGSTPMVVHSSASSGPVESACRQRQCRFKRSGQFWTAKGLRHLGALTEARYNHHWDELWLTT